MPLPRLAAAIESTATPPLVTKSMRQVSIFVTANLDDRIQRVQERHHCDKAAARKLLQHEENARASYYNYYTGKKWGHASSYDICVNTSILGIEGTTAFLADFIRKSQHIEG